MSAEKLEPGYCDRCQNTGEITCYCGGDMCLCGAGEKPCPKCNGGYGWDDDDYPDDLPEDPAIIGPRIEPPGGE